MSAHTLGLILICGVMLSICAAALIVAMDDWAGDTIDRLVHDALDRRREYERGDR